MLPQNKRNYMDDQKSTKSLYAIINLSRLDLIPIYLLRLEILCIEEAEKVESTTKRKIKQVVYV